MDLYIYFKPRWKRMAFPTANVRFETRPFGLFAKGRHLDPAPEGSCQRMGHFTAQLHEFAGIRPADGRDRAGAAQVSSPDSAEQAAFLLVAAAVVVAVEIFTFGSCWSFHLAISELPQFFTCGRI